MLLHQITNIQFHCALQDVFVYSNPTCYNSGVYGWNCDIYIHGGIAILTGYRNMRGTLIPQSVIDSFKYDRGTNFEQNINREYAFFDAVSEL